MHTQEQASIRYRQRYDRAQRFASFLRQSSAYTQGLLQWSKPSSCITRHVLRFLAEQPDVNMCAWLQPALANAGIPFDEKMRAWGESSFA